MKKVGRGRLELPCLAALAPKASASANFATSADLDNFNLFQAFCRGIKWLSNPSAFQMSLDQCLLHFGFPQLI